MRLAPTLLISSLVLFLLPAITALHPHRDSNKLASRTIASRQHRVPRALIDVCVYLDAKVLAKATGLPSLLFTGVDLCLCLKVRNQLIPTWVFCRRARFKQDLDIFLRTNVVADLLIGLLGGEQKVIAMLTAIVGKLVISHYR